MRAFFKCTLIETQQKYNTNKVQCVPKNVPLNERLMEFHTKESSESYLRKQFNLTVDASYN